MAAAGFEPCSLINQDKVRNCIRVNNLTELLNTCNILYLLSITVITDEKRTE